MSETMIIVICIAINGYLSAFEMGLVTIRPDSLRYLIDKGSQKAKKILNLRENLEQMLSTIQIGITIVAIISGTMIEKISTSFGIDLFLNLGLPANLAQLASNIFFVILVTYFTVVLGELVPKSLATKYPTGITFAFYHSMMIVKTAFYPFVYILEQSINLLSKLIQKIGSNIQRSEFEDAEEAFAVHRLSRLHRQYVFNLVNLQKQPMAKVMLPLEKVIKIDKSMTSHELLEILVRSGHTRVPVLCDGQFVGLLNAKEFLASEVSKWQSCIRPIIRVPESITPLHALRLMQSQRSHMCIIESKETKLPIGIATIEDILEEVFGEIYDEDDPTPGD